MKVKTTLLCLLAFLCFLPASAQCTSGSLNPSQAYTPVYDGNEYSIYSNAHPGEYMLVKTLSTATVYQFKSSTATDYITITDANGAQIFASGLSGANGINFTPPYPQTVRFYLHANAQCEANPFATRWRYLKTTTTTYSCDSPSNLSVSNITSNSAKISWNLPVIGINFSYDIYVNTTGVAPTSGTNPSLEVPVGTEGTVNNLTPGLTHYYWVRTQCVSDAGIWVPGGAFTTTASSGAGCNGAPYGLYPSTTVNLICNGSVEQIAADAFAGEYSNMYVSSNQQYTFSSSVATDYITITDPSGNQVYASGPTPLVWINNSNWGTIRYYLHTNANCGTSEAGRVKSVKCGGDVMGGCTEGSEYPSTTYTPACTGSNELIVNDAYAGEYSKINVSANKLYTFSTSVSTDYVTIVNPTGNVVLATGPAPLEWNSGTTSGVVWYFVHASVNCGTQNINRQRYIKCIAAPASCGAPTALAVSNITSNSCRMTWTAPATAPASYDLYIVTSNTAPNANSTATVTSTTAGVGVISGLNAATTYYYWIRSVCGATKSDWVSGGTFTTPAALNCNGASYGLYPDTTFTPACTGVFETITAQAFAGEYCNVNVVANKTYTFQSGVSTDYLTVTNAAGTVVLASGQTPLSWSSGTTTGVIRYFIHANASCGVQNTLRARSVRCLDAPAGACGMPSNLAVSNMTSNSCRMTWTAPATAPNSYDLYIVTSNTAPNANTAATVTSASAGIGVLSGLNSATTYYYWIRSVCGATKSDWVSGGSFTTLAALSCNSATNGLYPDATFTPACTGSFETITAQAYAGEYANVNVVTNKTYTFQSSVSTDYLTVTNAAGTVVLASGLTPLNWSSGTTSGVIRYYLHANANCGSQETVRTRTIRCVDAPAGNCAPPTNLVVSYVTSNSARLDWTPPASTPTGYDVYIITTNTPPTNDTPANNVTVLPGTGNMNSLPANTTYYFWVRSQCSGQRSAWVSGGSFTTLPSLTCNGAYYGLYPQATFTPACTGSFETIATDAYAGEFSRVNVVANQNYTFSSSVANDFLTITNAAGTVVLASGQTPLNWASGNTSGVVRFHLNTNGNCGTQASNRVRSVKCGTATEPTCLPPSQLFASNITSDSCRFNWIDPATLPTNYELYLSTVNTAPGASPAGLIWLPNYMMSAYAPLEPSTTYYFWLRSACDNYKSVWVSGGSFTTLASLQCNGAIFGLFPPDTITLQNTGAPEPVAFQAMASSYTNLIVEANRQYQFSTDIPTDIITVTNESGSTVLAHGPSPLTWTSGQNEAMVRFYIHADENCGPDDTPRTKYVKSTTLGLADLDVNQVSLYPNPTAGLFTVDTGSFTADAITVLDPLGRAIRTQVPVASRTVLSVEGLSDGVYYVKIRYNGHEATQKLMLKK